MRAYIQKSKFGLVKCIMDWIVQNGTMERQDLGNSDNLGWLSIGEGFAPTHIKTILDIIESM